MDYEGDMDYDLVNTPYHFLKNAWFARYEIQLPTNSIVPVYPCTRGLRVLEFRYTSIWQGFWYFGIWVFCSWYFVFILYIFSIFIFIKK